MKTDEADEKRKDAELLMLFFVDSDGLHLHRFVSRVSITPLTKLGELGVFLQIILLSKRFELQMPDWTQMKEN